MKHNKSKAARWFRHSVISIIPFLTATALAAPPQLPPDEEMPFDIPAFDASSMKATHARLFFSPDEAKLAKSRICDDAQIRKIYDRFMKKADEQLSLALEPIDESWWAEDKDKPWEQTYPRVFEKTWMEPARYANAAATLATAWLLTDEEKYAGRAIECLLHLAPYSYEPVHFDVGMNYSVWGLSMLKAYDVLLPRLDAGTRQRIDACMTRFARAVAKNDKYWITYGIGGRINNHLAWHKTTLGLLGLFYDRPDLIEYCMHGKRGLVPLLTDGLLDNGLWLESSLNYQFAAIIPMLTMADCQRRMNIKPGLAEITAPNGRTLKQSFDAMFNVLAPDCTIPTIGDCYGIRQQLYKVTMYEWCWKLWGDEKYAWLINQHDEPSVYMLFAPPLKKDAAAPPIRTLLRPEHGYAFLRSHTNHDYWRRDAAMAFLTFDRSSVHANADKLGIMLFRKDHMLVSDVEGRTTSQSHSFSSPITGQLNRGRLSQNTVMIDDQDQRYSNQLLRLVEFRDLAEEKRVTAADDDGILYPGVRQMRTIAMTDDYILDVFQVDCGRQQRQIDWVVHLLDENASPNPATQTVLVSAEPFELPKHVPWNWLREAKSFAPEQTIDLGWHHEDAHVRLMMLNPDAERVILCGYPSTDEPDCPLIPMVIVRTRTAHATFATVWLTGRSPRDVKLQALPDHDDQLVFKVTTRHPAGNRQSRQHHLIPKLK
jgi:hypothetical protein